jgi:hypothetical protein
VWLASLPETLCNLQGWSSITSMVYLSLLNLSPLRLWLPPVAPGLP